MNKEENILPELRFPEFTREGWEEDNLGNRGEFKGGGTPSRSNEAFWKGNIPWVSSSDIEDDNINNINISRYITEEALKKSATKLISKNSLLIVSRVGVGKLAVSRQDICTSQDFTNFTPKKDDLLFLGYYLKSRSNLLFNISQGMAIKGFTKEDISNLKITVPKHKQEQQKIANCLSSLDDVINAETEKLDLLQDHKKGLLQHLFPQQGESQPKYRFPEFRKDGGWELKEVGEIFEVTRGYVLSMSLVSLKQSKENNYPVYSSQTKNNGLAGFYNEYLYENAITWTTDGANAGDVNFREGKFYCTNVCGVLLNNEGLANKCVAEIINSVAKKHVSYVGNPKLMNGVMSKIKIALPSLKEQNKIADFLSSVDELIASQQQKLESLKAHKKGLLQKLFPKILN